MTIKEALEKIKYAPVIDIRCATDVYENECNIIEKSLEKLEKIEQLCNDWEDDYIDDSTFIEEIRKVFRNDK